MSSVATLPTAEDDILYAKGTPELFEQKAALWGRESTSLVRKLRVCVSDNEATRVLLALLRIITADEEDYFRLICGRGDRANNSYRSTRNANFPISIHNEITTLQALKTKCQKLLSLYPNTLEHDLELLKPENTANIPLYSNYRNAVIQVRGEKEVLHHYLDLAICGLKLLSFGMHQEEEFERELSEIKHNKHALIHSYCFNVVTVIRKQEFHKIVKTQRNLDLSKSMTV